METFSSLKLEIGMNKTRFLILTTKRWKIWDKFNRKKQFAITRRWKNFSWKENFGLTKRSSRYWYYRYLTVCFHFLHFISWLKWSVKIKNMIISNIVEDVTKISDYSFLLLDSGFFDSHWTLIQLQSFFIQNEYWSTIYESKISYASRFVLVCT